MTKPDITPYMSLPYQLEVRLKIDPDGDQRYIARHPELRGCLGQGSTRDEAVASLNEAKEMYIEALLEDNLEIPHPQVFRAVNSYGHSGRPAGNTRKLNIGDRDADITELPILAIAPKAPVGAPEPAHGKMSLSIREEAPAKQPVLHHAATHVQR